MNQQSATPVAYPDPIIPLDTAKDYADALAKYLSAEALNFRASYNSPAIASISPDIDIRLQKELQGEIERVVLRTLCRDCSFP